MGEVSCHETVIYILTALEAKYMNCYWIDLTLLKIWKGKCNKIRILGLGLCGPVTLGNTVLSFCEVGGVSGWERWPCKEQGSLCSLMLLWSLEHSNPQLARELECSESCFWKQGLAACEGMLS